MGDFRTVNRPYKVKLKLNFKNYKSSYLIHRALVAERKNSRQGTAMTKTRSQVRGGGRKPWKQKGTGRARAGSSTSPLWRGGGVIFGPQNKLYTSKLNKKERKLALNTLLANRLSKESVFTIQHLEKMLSTWGRENPFLKKTKDFFNFIKFVGLPPIDKWRGKGRVLIIVNVQLPSLIRVTKNLPDVQVTLVNNLNIKSLLNARKVIISTEALERFSTEPLKISLEKK
uniref:ribosomal protein L4 n=1 Tax=Haramonas pauciplastida TaxID=478668 RepID=UPI002114B771|nr:ribosomal protein L4 [Haramonas pauciplastida]UTE94980.1 ribosomal protein L4 [Haramonas pauciplastida]